ncbi:hypothetical protein SAMN05216226_102166 [Halovenus aranensis]|uniref:Uncharacterized protein n=1 Tax=Halovenus aranensis TaxID=890420 RepID=A0A1G8SVE3_9EURY|nr:hypothetical protein [Halovenus aranensis]SDJ33219.1 hypothetical protein SAMN05216226_102166 [Halovenus aranensis]
MSAILLAVVGVLAALGIAYWYPERTEWALQRILVARRAIFSAVAVLTAFIFLGTGSPILVTVGFVMIVLMVWTVFFETNIEEAVR